MMPMRRLAVSIVRRYPAAWRERYEDEVLALIDATPVRVSDLDDLFRGLICERMRAAIADAEHPRRTARLLNLFAPVVALVFLGAAWGAGLALRQWRPLSSGWGEPAVLIISVGWLMLFTVSVVATLRQNAVQTTGVPFVRPVQPAGYALGLLAVFFVTIALATWTDWADDGRTQPAVVVVMDRLNLLFSAWLIATWLVSAFSPGRQMLSRLAELQFFNGQVLGANAWVQGCHEMIAKGIPSPLPEAEAQVEQWTRKRDDALAQVEALSYRSRFNIGGTSTT